MSCIVVSYLVHNALRIVMLETYSLPRNTTAIVAIQLTTIHATVCKVDGCPAPSESTGAGKTCPPDFSLMTSVESLMGISKMSASFETDGGSAETGHRTGYICSLAETTFCRH